MPTRKGRSKGGYSTVSPDAYARFWEKDTVCHWCAYIYAVEGTTACPRCNTPFDPEQAAKARFRENSTFLDRLPPEKRKSTLRRRKYGESSDFDFKGVYGAIMGYLNEKRGKKPSPRNKKRPATNV